MFEASGHIVNRHHMDFLLTYKGDYVDAVYGSLDGLRAAFRNVIALSPERSDNAGRVSRLCAFAADYYGDSRPRAILDIGSVLGDFT
jgi:hypothetical protein